MSGAVHPEPWARPPLDLAFQQRLASLLAPFLLALFFSLYIIGDHPFAVGDVDKAAATESGSLLNRLLIFGTFAAALPVALVWLGAVFRLLLANLLGLAIVLWSALTFLWASHPDLTIRRAVAFAIVYGSLVILVAASRSAANVLRAFTFVFVLITLLNIFVMVAMPAVSWSPIGENGIFDAKNSAGTVGMLTVIMLGAAMAAARSLGWRAVLACIYLLSWLFLILTRSKTSIGVAVLMTLFMPVYYLLLTQGRGLRILALLAALFLGTGILTLFAAAGGSTDDLTLLLFGDLTFSLRTPIWTDVVKSIADRPWLGHGFGSFWDIGAIYNPLRHAPYNAFYMEAQEINTAHNGYLDQLLQTGIVGFGLGLIAIVRCLWVLQSAAVQTDDRTERLALLGASAIAICLVLNNLLESYLFRPGDAMGFLFFALMLQGEQALIHLRQQRASLSAVAATDPGLGEGGHAAMAGESRP